MTATAYRQVAAGVGIALVVPALFASLAVLVERGIVSFNRPIDWTPFTIMALSEIVLGPIGVAIAGRGAGVRGPIAWLVLFVVSMPVLLFVWFYSVAMVSGALGAPF